MRDFRVRAPGDASGHVRGVRLEKNRLAPSDDGSLRPRGTGEFEELEAGQVFASIGYRGHAIPGVPFDDRRGVVANDKGRVVDTLNWSVIPGQYAVGWAAMGPQGLIGMHKAASGAVAQEMLEDVQTRAVVPKELSAIEARLNERGVAYVTFGAWQRIDAAEVERGRTRGAPRSKFARVEDMLEASRSAVDEKENRDG